MNKGFLSRFTLEWLDTTLAAIWLLVSFYVLMATTFNVLVAQPWFANMVAPRLPSPQAVVSMFGFAFFAASAARLLAARERTQWILVVAWAAAYAAGKVMRATRLAQPSQFGAIPEAALVGTLLAVFTALLPHFSYVQHIWKRIKPAARPGRPRRIPPAVTQQLHE